MTVMLPRLATFVELPVASASAAGTEFACASAVPPQDSATTEITAKYKLRFLLSLHGNFSIGFIFFSLRHRTPSVSVNSLWLMQTKSSQPKLTGLDLGRRNCGRGAALRKIFDGRTESGNDEVTRRFNYQGRRRNNDFTGCGAYFSVGDQRDCAMVIRFVRVLVNPFVQRGARRHRVEEQNHSCQQRRERRLAEAKMLWCTFHLRLTGLKLSDDDGYRKSREQGGRQFEPIVRMELQFRQQIAAGDAQERTGAKGQRGAEYRRAAGGEPRGAGIKQRRPQRRGQRKQEIQDVP